MRRPGVIAILCLALAATGALPVAAARPAPSLDARASDARVGGVMRVVAGVRHPVRDTSLAASAVIHFACGDVKVDLEPVGRGNRVRALVPVAMGEIPGDVVVEVTIVYGEQTESVSDTATVRTRRHAPPADCGATQQEN